MQWVFCWLRPAPEPRSPAAFAPFRQVWALAAQRGVVTVPGIDDGVVAVGVEHLAAHIAEQLLERAGLPGLAHTAREYRRF